jgi:hypothetical protein
LFVVFTTSHSLLFYTENRMRKRMKKSHRR